ncbi:MULTISPECIES: PhnD/SsuA/transferrin family substrate-binding protein [Metasolibacillus]|uniref:PhnD/SsuA/transferrin family substrate-binding protein n=1 Tax=Metasolibacillus TaxID=2703677 RepID=UPI00079B230E|nr:PhnD/SsuA/transferrin family substrate-binding protein [Metasolibacillus fluoroglycofenilyticus]KYG89731.1 phosphonate ABC transporter substrate-binding protein [[Bacillus] sp. KCTC 13219]
MSKKWILLFSMILCAIFLVACNSEEGTSSGTVAANESNGNAAKSKSNEPLVMVWYPNESGSEMAGARDAFGKIFEEATGRKVEQKLTTDYAIAIEAIASGNAQVAFMGPQGYIEANNKSADVQPIVVPSGSSGTLEDAVYYSWLAVPKDKADEYKVNGEFSIDTIANKKMSFVSASSTSGFKVPSSSIVAHFSKQDAYKSLKQDDLIESNALFPEVLFGDSHQGSAVNMLMERSDVSAFCDTCVSAYVDLVEGEPNTAGAVYRVKDDAAAPFNNLPGKEFTLISSTPVLNSPFVVNTSALTAEEITKLTELLISDETANNKTIFVPKDSGEIGLFSKSADERFVQVNDAWFDPIRKLSE